MLFNKSFIAFIIGVLIMVEGAFMLFPGLVSLWYGEPDIPYHFLSALICCIVGSAMAFIFRKHSKMFGKRDGYIIVSSVWVVFSFFGLMPFWISGYIPSFTDAFYETMSGFTTTGSTILTDVEALPHGLLFWRSLTQWLGGMGIIMLSIAILPMLGIGGMQLYSAESSGAMSDKLRPKISDMAKYMWIIYLSLTIIESVLLMLGGMSPFDAVCHSLSTLATGGYSTKNNSVAFFDSAYIEYVIMFFTFLGGVNFALYYALAIGKMHRLQIDDELKYYTLITVVIGIVAGIILYNSDFGLTLEKSIRNCMFLIISVVTTTGFTTCDYSLWPHVLTVIITLLLIAGGCAGSTSGGLKVIRQILMAKSGIYELRHMLHPTAILHVKVNGKAIPNSSLVSTMSFVSIYFCIIVGGTIVMSLVGYNFEDSYGLVANSIANVGVSIGNFGPAGPYTFAMLPAFVKWMLAFIMLVGRLELFTFILLFTPSFWKQ